MAAPASIAVESAKRAVRAGLAAAGSDLDCALVLSALHHTLSDEAKEMCVCTSVRIDALTRALAIEVSLIVAASGGANADAARAVLRNAHALATAQLEILLALPRANTPDGGNVHA